MLWRRKKEGASPSVPDDQITRRDSKSTWNRKTGETHTFHLNPFQGYRLEVDDIHFNLDSAVFLPALGDTTNVSEDPSVGLGAVSEALLQIKKNPARKVLVCGHADTSGDAGYNIGLSVKRKDCVKAVLLGDKELFKKVCGGQHKSKDVDHILNWVAKLYGWDCAVSGQTQSQALKKFQQRYNIEWEAKISEDGALGPQTWGAFFDVYEDMILNLTETDPAGLAELRSKFQAAGVAPGFVGCGENFPLPKNDPVFGGELSKPPDNYRSQADRRAEILFYDPGQVPKMDCHPGGDKCTAELCEVYNTKMYRYKVIDVPDSKPKGTQVFLKMQYLDPEGKDKVFPKDFPVKVVYSKDNSEEEVKVGDEGLLRFAAKRKDSFILKFEFAETTWIAVSADDKTNKIAKKADLAQLHKDKFRFFSVPKAKWTLVESKWEVSKNKFYKDDPDFKFFIPGRYGLTIGTSGEPVQMKLDPHWSFLRFEFFDRTFGHSDHNHKRVNTPAMLIEGWRNSPAAGESDTSSHWTINDTDVEKAVHAIPWILQRKSDKSDDARPDKNIQFGFKTDWLHATEQAFVVSKSATDRVIETRADNHADLAPAAKRLEFYDLPKEWISKKYYCRFTDNTGKFFDQAGTFEDKIKASLKAPDKPLIFSLDDIVLTDAACAPITLHASDRVAVFFHKFEPLAGAGTIGPTGVWDPDTGTDQSFLTKFQPNGVNYLHDYGNWTRAVVAQGNFFDCFSERVKSGDLLGARAAVRWVDAVAAAAPGAPAPGVANPPDLPAGTVRTDKKYFSCHPCFTQYYADMPAKYTGPSMATSQTGRYDMLLLRCCDRDADKEKCVNVHHFRIHFNFSVAPSGGKTQAQYIDQLCTNVGARWHANDGVNIKRTELIPKDAANKLQGSVVLYLAPATDPTGAQPWTRAHYRVTIVSAAAGRNFMNSRKGFGEFGNTGWQPEGQYAAGSYTAAHEVGHGDGLPDEYCERWWGCSYGELSFWSRTPGDIYDPDGRSDPAPPNRGAVVVESGMMTGVVQMRNRYHWHCAEFFRAVTKAAGQGGTNGVTFKVKYDTFDDFWVPPHDNFPDRSYVYWPINQAIDVTHGSRGKFDLLLFSTGKDKYTTSTIDPAHASVASPFDGVLVFYVLLDFTFNSWPAAPPAPADAWPSHLLPLLRGVVQATFNKKFAAKGTINAGTPKEWEFKKCLVRFTPRVRVTSPADPQDTDYATHLGWLSGITSHFDVAMDKASVFSTPSWGVFARHTLTMNVKTSDPNWSAKMQSQFRDKFAEMIGLADATAVNKANLRPLIQKVITGGDVVDL
jgi:hypothetical protein